MGKRLQLPPDDVADWSSVGIEVHAYDSTRSFFMASQRPARIYKWLDTQTEGKYYTNSFSRYMVVSFELESDALMFALTWTGGPNGT